MKFRASIPNLVMVAMLLPSFLMAQATPFSPVQTGTVTGVVRTAAGAPAVGIRVTAMRTDAMDDALRAMVSLTQTDSTGRYRLENVPAGRYYIAAGRVDLPTYYPGTLDMTAGTAISVSSAASLTDIDFVIQETSATVPPTRGGFGVRGANRGTFQISPVTPNPGRGQAQGAPVLPQIARVPVAPNQVRPAPSVQLRGRGTNPGAIGVIAAQPSATWWTNAALVARLGLTDDQKKKVESTFDQHRQAIVQNTTDLAKEEGTLTRMLEADPLEPAKTVSAQIDRVIQARGELERTNSKMTLEMRQTLTRAQWLQLQMETQLPVTQLPVLNAAPAVQWNGVRPIPNAPR